jgi:hypothetical protein
MTTMAPGVSTGLKKFRQYVSNPGLSIAPAVTMAEVVP